jgi:hypothetical protein
MSLGCGQRPGISYKIEEFGRDLVLAPLSRLVAQLRDLLRHV